jgi:ABC-type uncharacterized transport system ATPase subunit
MHIKKIQPIEAAHRLRHIPSDTRIIEITSLCDVTDLQMGNDQKVQYLNIVMRKPEAVPDPLNDLPADQGMALAPPFPTS